MELLWAFGGLGPDMGSRTYEKGQELLLFLHAGGKASVLSEIKENVNVSYGVFKTTYEQKYCYCIKYSSMVQSYAELLDDQDIG